VVKGESGFLGILKEVSGTVQFDEKMAKMQMALTEASYKKQVLSTTLGEINAKLQGLQIDKEAFREIEVVEMEKRAYQRLLYLQKIEVQNGQISELRTEKQSLMMEREVVLRRREAQMTQTSDQKDRVELLQNELK
jgi:chromosome segregation ATPase